jgi:hypothetical protein
LGFLTPGRMPKVLWGRGRRTGGFDMKHALTAFLSAVSICALSCLVPGVAAANGSDANAQANQAQLHPWEANQTGWTPYGVPVGEVYPAAPGGFIGPNGYHQFGYDEVVPFVPAVGGYDYGYGSAPAYGHPVPAYGYHAPAYGHPVPAYGYPAPAYDHAPAYGYPAPANGYSEPANGYPEPEYAYPAPASGYSEPANGYPELE